MKRTILTVLALGAVVASASTADAFNHTSRASYNAEMRQQHARIADGRRSGALTRGEHRTVYSDLKRIGSMGYNSTSKMMLSRHSKKVNFHKTN